MIKRLLPKTNYTPEGYDRFIVIKDFYKIGSAVMYFNKENDEEFRSLLSRCLMLAKSPLQVVRLGGPNCLDIYAEYAPYTVIAEEQEMLNICITGNCPGYTEEEYIKLFCR